MKKLLFLLTGIICSMAMFGQARSQADVSVIAVTLGNAPVRPIATIPNPNPTGQVIKNPRPVDNKLLNSQNLTCAITVHNENDDDAYETILVAILPVEVDVVTRPANATVHKLSSNSPYAGYITFNLGHMTVGQNITVEFTFNKSKYGNKVGAYAYSLTSDPNPANNYKDATF
jgi:hypothetical protein